MSQEPKKYAFQGKIIKLLEDDYNRWRGIFTAIPDLAAYLFTLDEYYQGLVQEGKVTEAEMRSRWFLRTNKACYNEHLRWVVKNKNAPQTSDEKTDVWDVH